MSHNHRAPPTPEEPPSVTNISNHFSRLYLNHKAHSSDTTKSLTKSHSQKTKKTHYYYTNKPVKKHTQDDDQEPQDNIKRAIVVSNKIPIKKHEQQDLKGCENLKSKDEGKKHGYDEMSKVSHGYDLKKEALLLGRDRRRSFGSSSSKSELTDFFACNGVKVVSVDMPPYMQIHVVDVTRKTYDSLEKFTAKTLALTLKKVYEFI
ncbi:putative dynein light chain, type 1/2 [Tanacetum coccineum]